MGEYMECRTGTQSVCTHTFCKEAEMKRRTEIDGIPRYIRNDGAIMKCDWELTGDVEVLEGESLEEHIASLMEQQVKSTE